MKKPTTNDVVMILFCLVFVSVCTYLFISESHKHNESMMLLLEDINDTYEHRYKLLTHDIEQLERQFGILDNTFDLMQNDIDKTTANLLDMVKTQNESAEIIKEIMEIMQTKLEGRK